MPAAQRTASAAAAIAIVSWLLRFMADPFLTEISMFAPESGTAYHAASSPRRLPWSTEEQDVAVRIANLEPAQTIVSIFERHAERCSTIGKFSGERIRICYIDVGIPSHIRMARVVRQRRNVFLGLDEYLRSIAADDREKRVSIRLLESRLKAKLVAVKSDSLIDVADDEER